MWELSPIELRVGATAICLGLAARWQALLLGYSADDFRIFVDGQGLPAQHALAQGRSLGYVLHAGLTAIGVAMPESSVLGSMLLMVVLVAMGIGVCRLWGIRNDARASAIVVLLTVLHPYQAEVFSFRMTTLFLAIPLALSFWAILECTRSRASWLLSLTAVICSLAIYQVVINYIAMALLFSVVFHAARVGDAPARFWRDLRSRCILVGTGMVVYGALTLAISRMSGITFERRGTLVSLDEIVPRLQSAMTLANVMFLRTEPVLPVATKVLILLLLGLSVVFILCFDRRSAPSRTLALTLAIIGGVPLCIGTVLVLGSWWPVPRVLAQTGMFWGGMFAVVYCWARPAGQRVLIAGLVVIVFSFVGINNVIFSDQLRMNARDLNKANRIVARIESLPKFDQIEGVVVIGGFWAYPSRIQTIQGNLNASALSVPWSRVAVLNEATGYRFPLSPPPAAVQKASAYCKTSPKWPAAESVVRLDSIAVVCLG